MNPSERTASSSLRLSPVGLRYREAFSDLRGIVRNLSEAKESDFERAAAALGALPLASDDFGTARCRVDNAQAAAAREEYGAARYELRLLANWLASRAIVYLGQAQPREGAIAEGHTPDLRKVLLPQFRSPLPLLRRDGAAQRRLAK